LASRRNSGNNIEEATNGYIVSFWDGFNKPGNRIYGYMSLKGMT
jgi:hypothetical protein